MRVSNMMIHNQTVTNLNNRSENFYDLNERVSTGKQVNRPSDNPIDAGRIVGFRSLLGSLDQYKRNIDSGLSWVSYTESTLGQAEEVLMEAKGVAEQMATGSYDANQRGMLVVQAEQLFDQMMQLGNTKVVDRYLFSGYRTDTQAFTRDNDFNITYNGDRSKIEVSIQSNIKVQINTTGQEAFIDGTNVFDVLKDLRDALARNDQDAVGQMLPRIDSALNQLLAERAAVGTSMKQMQSAQMILQEFSTGTEELLSATEDEDMIEAVTELRTQEVAYEAALKSTSLISGLSLVNYL